MACDIRCPFGALRNPPKKFQTVPHATPKRRPPQRLQTRPKKLKAQVSFPTEDKGSSSIVDNSVWTRLSLHGCNGGPVYCLLKWSMLWTSSLKIASSTSQFQPSLGFYTFPSLHLYDFMVPSFRAIQRKCLEMRRVKSIFCLILKWQIILPLLTKQASPD
jgi:hypothetical protein